MRHFTSLLLLLLLLLLFLTLAAPASAQTRPGLLLPVGGGYTDTYNALAQHAIANARGETVHILVLASTYATNPNSITQAEFQQNMKDGGERRLQVEGACQRNLPPGSSLTCKVELLPIFTREDASKPENLAYFTDDVAMIYILGGDQEIGMGAILGTPVEERINQLHAAGAIVAGTSAGAAMLSRAMIVSLQTNYSNEGGLFFGSTRLSNSETQRGFDFGLRSAVIDQHFYQRARMGRLLTVITQPGLPHLGVGIDAYTGVVVDDEVLRDVFGLYTVTILDAETYHAADSARYVTFSPDRPPLLSLRNVLLHLMSPGDVTYDLKTRSFSLAAAPARIERDFEVLRTPPGAGTLFLAGDLSETLKDSPILKRFVEVAGGAGANIVVIAEGGASISANERFAKKYADALNNLGAHASVLVPDEQGNYPPLPSDAAAFVIAGKDASKMKPPAWLEEPWRAGKPILADNAAAPLFGAYYSAHGPTPDDSEQEEIAVQRSFWQGRTTIQPGVGYLNITVEPQLLADLRFGRLFSLAYNHPDLLAIGLNKDTALEINEQGATVLGENAVFVLDLRHAARKLGTNDGFIIANALLDTFAPGETSQIVRVMANADLLAE
ncbi:MAG: cyanophycinase, partial [Chloroflexi bacterium]|nr:cyanophycinase [Chloroflexota bacterium]